MASRAPWVDWRRAFATTKSAVPPNMHSDQDKARLSGYLSSRLPARLPRYFHHYFQPKQRTQ